MRPITTTCALNPILGLGSGVSPEKRSGTDDSTTTKTATPTDEPVSQPDVAELIDKLVRAVRGFLKTHKETSEALDQLQELITKLSTVEGIVEVHWLTDAVWIAPLDLDGDGENDASALEIRRYVLHHWCEDPWTAEREITKILNDMREVHEIDRRIHERVEKLLKGLRSMFQEMVM